MWQFFLGVDDGRIGYVCLGGFYGDYLYRAGIYVPTLVDRYY